MPMCAHISLFQICECILDHCLAPDCRLGGVGCDNMTVIIVCFLNGRGYSDLAMRCAVPAKVTPSPTHQFSENKETPRWTAMYESAGPPPTYTPQILQPAKLNMFESTNGIEDSSRNQSTRYDDDLGSPLPLYDDPGIELPTESPV